MKVSKAQGAYLIFHTGDQADGIFEGKTPGINGGIQTSDPGRGRRRIRGFNTPLSGRRPGEAASVLIDWNHCILRDFHIQ